MAGVMDDLVTWLRAQLDEDAGREIHDHWCGRFRDYDYGTRQGHCDCEATDRLQREVEAKRQILDEHSPRMAGFRRFVDGALEPAGGPFCVRCMSGLKRYPFPCPTVRLLARPYADRPGYREATSAR